MRLSAILTLCLACGGVAEAEETFTACEIRSESAVPKTANRAYRLCIPPAAAGADKWPLVIFMHGSGAKGDDNLKQVAEPIPKILSTPDKQQRFPCFILAPQCRDGDDSSGRPNNWVKWKGPIKAEPAEWAESETEPSDQLQAAMAALDDVLATHPVDTTRIYLVGASMGGSASWWWAAHAPKRFAAVIPVCGLSEVAKAPTLARLPIWTFHGSDDALVPVQRTRDMVAALRAAGSGVKYTDLAGAGHGIAKRVFEEDGHAALRWLFDQRRTAP